MPSVTRSVHILAKPKRVWEVLAALDDYPRWEGGYVAADYVGEQRSGLGTRREVRLRSPMGVRRALHEVTAWAARKRIAWRAVESNFPMLAAAEQTVTLSADGDGTRVENTVEYSLSMGFLGRLADGMMFRRVVVGANEGFVEALRMEAEA